MQRIIQINIAGRLIAIEEDAYSMIRDYINALERQFAGADGKEIIEDIESRISELFSIRLQSGSPAIDRFDVQKVIDTLGDPNDIHDGPKSSAATSAALSVTYTGYKKSGSGRQESNGRRQRLFRDPYDKVIGGVCSGLSHYFDIDVVIFRLILLVLLLSAGIGVIPYLVAWAVIPVATSREELEYGSSVTIHDIGRNVTEELHDLKKRGEQMSAELKDFFSKKK